MTQLQVIEATPSTLFGTDNAADIVRGATARADALAGVIRTRNLSVTISGKEFVKVEGWTMLGSMLGVFPVLIWSKPVDMGWEARVEARTMDGRVVGAAEAQCCRDEDRWSNRPDNALRSMAQTRATSKALRLPLGFVMALAGYETSAAEEMDGSVRRIVDVRATPQHDDDTPQHDDDGRIFGWLEVCPIHNVRWVDGRNGPWHRPLEEGESSCGLKDYQRNEFERLRAKLRMDGRQTDAFMKARGLSGWTNLDAREQAGILYDLMDLELGIGGAPPATV